MQIISKLENAILYIFVFFLQVLVCEDDFDELALWIDLLLDDAADFGLCCACQPSQPRPYDVHLELYAGQLVAGLLRGFGQLLENLKRLERVGLIFLGAGFALVVHLARPRSIRFRTFPRRSALGLASLMCLQNVVQTYPVGNATLFEDELARQF